jgi:hypothetical protein
MTAWRQRHLAWIKEHRAFRAAGAEATLLDHRHEVEHAAGRIERLERVIDRPCTAPRGCVP